MCKKPEPGQKQGWVWGKLISSSPGKERKGYRVDLQVLQQKWRKALKKKKKRRRYLEVPLLAFGSCHWPRVYMHTEAQAYKSISQQIPPLTAPPKHSDPASFGLHITSNSSHYDGKGGAGTTEECRSQRALTTQAFGLDHTVSHSQLTSHTGSTVGNTTSASGPH